MDSVWEIVSVVTSALRCGADAVLILDDIETCQYCARMKRLTDPDALLLQGAADPTRLAILRQLSSGGAICACDFTARCGGAPPTGRHHPQVLREAGGGGPGRRGAHGYYSPRPPAGGGLPE